jgi:hypothetical protein
MAAIPEDSIDILESVTNIHHKQTEPQDFPHQAEACESPEAEPSHPAMDPSADR